jgi:flagellar basal body rod protein FlgC
MSSVLSIGGGAMRSAATRFDLAASQVVRAGTAGQGSALGDQPDLAAAVVAMSLASYDFKAAVKVATVGREMMQSALDMLA